MGKHFLVMMPVILYAFLLGMISAAIGTTLTPDVFTSGDAFKLAISIGGIMFIAFCAGEENAKK